MSKQIKIEIKNRWTGNILFEYLSENNTIKKTVSEAIKSEANLRRANLCGADLCGADLYGANLRRANLRGADLCEAKGAYMACPTDGSFIGWKKASGYVVKLQIPEDARRSSAGGEKCRCDKAYVAEIQNADGPKPTSRQFIRTMTTTSCIRSALPSRSLILTIAVGMNAHRVFIYSSTVGRLWSIRSAVR